MASSRVTCAAAAWLSIPPALLRGTGRAWTRRRTSGTLKSANFCRGLHVGVSTSVSCKTMANRHHAVPAIDTTRRELQSQTLPLRRRWFGSKAGGDDTGEGSEAAAEEGGMAMVGSTLRFETIVDGDPITPESFEGKAVLIVNTASLCGLTPQLKELEQVYGRFKEEGLVVLGVPSNDFGGQEPWEEEEIKKFYEKEYAVTFPLTSKTTVIGPAAHPLYSTVTATFGPDVGPQWNFHKLLVGRDGALAGVFGSNLSPLEPDVTEAIEDALRPIEAGSA